MDRYVVDLLEIGQEQVAAAGGKGALLGELSRIAGISVPPGFCITTTAFERCVAPSIADLVDRLGRVAPGERQVIHALSAEVRGTIERIAIPDDLSAAIDERLAHFGVRDAFAVRSSATAEDSPTASFAGQHDTYLNVVGTAAVLEHVRRCWASLFSERAVHYRLRNGVDHRSVQMAVIVQRMVVPDAAGVLFTADPVSGHRRMAVIEAVAGLGDALVSGTATAERFTVLDGRVIARSDAAIRRPTSGGAPQAALDAPARGPALTDDQAVRLTEFGRRIEAHFGRPQDIEWCLRDDEFLFVQSRPITTLFPIPERADSGNHVYISVGHQQMMTDAMKPLGLSFWQMTTPRPMAEAGGRLFVDVTQALASPASRSSLLAMLEKSDPLIGDALQSILDRPDFLPIVPDAGPVWTPPSSGDNPPETDPAIVTTLIERSEASLAAVKRDIGETSGTALLDFILADIQELRRVLHDPRSRSVIMAGMEAAWWLNEHLEAWLGERNAVDTLTQSVPNNVTSEMGLALLDVADAVRKHPDVVAFLERADDDEFLEQLPALDGGLAARDAIHTWLAQYGMRGVGEIDITRPRWSEQPRLLLPLILGHVRNFEPGEAARRFEHGRQAAWQKEQDVLARLRALPDGETKAEETKRMIDRVRTFAGFREYPKFGMISRYFVYKRALMGEAGRLVRAGVLREPDDIFYLRFEELRDVVRANRVDHDLIRDRREAFRSHQSLNPPRVLTSDGEAVAGAYRRRVVPPGALAGLAVSAGVVEGRARVVLDVAAANLEPGDILVTAYTDPSWTAHFVAIRGLVTEVGGLMTHGAVIAREYGLPAVVGVEHATRLITDGQRIRVNGTDGFVEVVG